MTGFAPLRGHETSENGYKDRSSPPPSFTLEISYIDGFENAVIP